MVKRGRQRKIKSKGIKVFCQPYKDGKSISSWFYKQVPKRNHCKYDQIRLVIGNEEEIDLWMTPNEAADCIRALSSSLSFWLVNNTN